MNRPAKILFTIPNFVTAGSQWEMVRLVERLDRSQFDPSIAVLRRGGTAIESKIEELGIPLIEAPFAVASHLRPSAVSRWRQAAATLRPYQFDLWHSYHYSDDYSEPIVARMAGVRGWVYTKKNMSWAGRGWKIRSLLATRIVSRNTVMMSDFFSQPWFKGKTRLIPCGVDTERFSPDVPQRLGLRAQLNLAEDAIMAGVVAHLVPVKGHPTLIRAIAGIPNMHAILAGAPTDEAYVAELRQLAASLGIANRVHLVGNIRDIPALNAELDVFVLPTKASGRGEGFGVALIEAMSCGVPCVATEIHGPKDIIVSGESGVLVPPEDPVALEAVLRRIAEDPEYRRALGQSARDRVLSTYTIEGEVAQTQQVYQSILQAA